MKTTVLLNHSDNTQEVEAEMKASFLRGLLYQTFDGTEAVEKLEFIWPEDTVLTVEQKMELRGMLAAYEVQVLDNTETMQVFFEKDLIGEWHKPTYKLKRDQSALDKRKQLYLEMNIEFSSVFEEENNEE